MRAYSAEALRALNYQPLEAAEGPAALAILEQRSDISVLFSDVVLPGGMNGFDLAQAARARRPGIKVLLTSGYSERAGAARGEEADIVLEKPFRPTELGRRLAALLGRGPA
jgi:CheY-like chemotaxis protein